MLSPTQGRLINLRHQAIVDNVASSVIGAATICLLQHRVHELISALVTTPTGQSAMMNEKKAEEMGSRTRLGSRRRTAPLPWSGDRRPG